MEQKDKILWKSYELFKRFGVRSVTMDEIAQQCGVSKKTVYQFFEDKDTLVESIILTFTQHTQQTCTTQQLQAENAIHEIFLSIEMVAQMIEGVNPALMNDLRKYHSRAYAGLEKHKQEFMGKFFRENIERGIREGLYRDELSLEIITPFYLHCAMVPVEQDIFPRNKHSISEIDYEITLFLLYGLATPKGIKLIEKYKQLRLKPQTV